VHKAQ
jgi:hypothetical protein